MSRQFIYASGLAARRLSRVLAFLSMMSFSFAIAFQFISPVQAAGPLSVPTTNPRYFVDQSGKAVYLAGTYLDHEQIALGAVDFSGYLDFLQQQKHNFTRLWAWQQTPLTAKNPLLTLPYERTGPRLALDGGPKFDLRRFNQDYFDQLRAWVVQAAERGVYVSVVLFQSSYGQTKQSQLNSWYANPFNRANNINRIDGDTNRNGSGEEAFALTIPTLTSYQEAYIRKIVDTLNDLDNVLYEISGDGPLGSSAWQYHMIDYLKTYEATQLKQHPVGTSYLSGTSTTDAFNSPADWIAVSGATLDAPLAIGQKVLFIGASPELLADKSSHQSVWKSFARGFNLIDKELDSLTPGVSESFHAAIGQSLAYSQFLNLSAMAPSSTVCSSGYCLVNPGAEYLIYIPSSGQVSIDLSGTSQNYLSSWFNPATGETVSGNSIGGGGHVTLSSRFRKETVLYLSAQVPNSTSNASTTIGTSGGNTPLATQSSLTVSPTSSNSKKGVSTPTITPSGGAFVGSVSVALGDATSGASIYYTIDGSSPTPSSKKYSGPFTITTNTFVKAIAFKNNVRSSEASAWFAQVSSFDFALADAGNISVIAGSSVSNSVTATLSSGSSQAVSFSVSGLPSGATGAFSSASCSPTCSSTLTISTTGSTPAGNFPITVTSTGGSLTRTMAFTLSVATASTVTTPTITPNGGSFVGSVSVAMQTATSGASIYYTTDGSTPTQSSLLYTGAITLTSSAVIRAKAFKSGYNASVETSASFTVNQGLVAYWKFDEGTGTTAADSSGNENTGTLTNGPLWTTGKIGNALYFDGIDDNVVVMDSTSLDLTTSFTLSAWVNPASASTYFTPVVVKNYKYWLFASAAGYCGDGSPIAGFTEGAHHAVCQPLPLPTNTWTHLAVTYDGSMLTLYRNGIAVGTTAVSSTLSPTTGTLQIGSSQDASYFKGLIDEVRIYNRSLSATELQDMYQQDSLVTSQDVAVPVISPTGGSYTLTQPFDFSLSNSGNQSVVAGSSVNNTIATTLVSGNSQAVSFSVSGLPSGATGSFSSASCGPTCSTVLTISTGTTTAASDYPITISATGGGVTKTTAFTLSISAAVTLVVTTPTITPNGGNFSGLVSVAMQTATPGASIYYTTDGSTPTQSSSLYTSTITLTSSATVNAQAFKSGSNASAVASASFVNTGSGKTYYVAKTGSDSNSCTQAQSALSAKLTIAAGLGCLAGGDTLIIKAGTYAEFINYNQIPSGRGSWDTATKVIAEVQGTVTLRPNTGGGAGDVVWFYDQTYVILDGLIIDATNVPVQGIRYNNGASYVRVQNTEVKNAPHSNCIGIQNERSNFNEFINLKVHDCGTPGEQSHGIYLRGSNHLVERSEIYNIASHGIHLWNTNHPNDNNVVRNNLVHDSGSRGILIGSGNNNVAYNNTVWNNGAALNAEGMTIGFNSASNNQVYNNTVYSNAAQCIVIKSDSSYATVTTNTCWQNGVDTIIDQGFGSIVRDNSVADPLVGSGLIP